MRGMTQLPLMALLTFFGWTTYASAASIVLNEVMWDGDEYIELHNTTGEDISLREWRITRQKDGGEEQVIYTFEDNHNIAAAGYFLLEKKEEATTLSADATAGSLTLVNTGERLQLYDHTGSLVDTAGEFGPWPAGKNTETGVSMERHGSQWKSSTGSSGGRSGTPGVENSSGEQSTSTDSPPEEESHTYTTDVIISEILPNPKGSDTEGEFIELYNPTNDTADLSGWKLDDAAGGSSPHILPDGTHISPRSYAVFWSSDTHIALNNTEDSARLLDPSGAVHQEVRYTTGIEDQSHNHSGNEYVVSTTSTPGSANTITQAESRSASATPTPKPSSKSSPTPTPTTSKAVPVSFDIKVWRVLADPEGSDDDAEYIELKNIGTKNISLAGWQLDDEEGGSKPYVLPEGTELRAGATYQFFREETNIALNNTGDTARLLAQDGTILDEFAFGTVEEGQVLEAGQGEVAGATTESDEEIVSDDEKETATPNPDTDTEEASAPNGGQPTGGALTGGYAAGAEQGEGTDASRKRNTVAASLLLVGAGGAAVMGYGKPEYVKRLFKK